MTITEAKRAQNRAAAARRKAKKAAEAPTDLAARRSAKKAAEALDDLTAEEIAPGPGNLEIEIEDLAPAAPLSFKDRMTARFKSGKDAVTKKPARRGKKVEVNFLTKSLPIISGVIASYAENLFKDPYKGCAPKREEVVAIISPIFAIVERRIQVSGELSEDAMDMLSVGMALLGYAGRTYTTYIDIKKLVGKGNAQTSGKEQVAASGGDRVASQPDQGVNDLIAGFGRANNTPALSGSGGDSLFQPGGDFAEFQASNDAALSSGDVAADDPADRSRQLAIVAQAFRRDYTYRAQNGHL